MDLRDRLSLRYLRHMVETPKGRAFILTQLADAESNGESAVFDRILARVADPELQRMVAKHRDDEVRHAHLYRAAAARQGVPLEEPPAHLKLIDRLDRAAGGFLDKPIVDGRDVMEAYVMLQVIEERGITQFKLLEQAFRAVDAATADVIADIARDEERHLRYCVAIARRYAPDEETRLATLARYRALEARCFADNSRALMEHTHKNGHFAAGPLTKLFWRAVQGLGARQGLPYTSFAVADKPASQRLAWAA